MLGSSIHKKKKGRRGDSAKQEWEALQGQGVRPTSKVKVSISEKGGTHQKDPETSTMFASSKQGVFFFV